MENDERTKLKNSISVKEMLLEGSLGWVMERNTAVPSLNKERRRNERNSFIEFKAAVTTVGMMCGIQREATTLLP
jgi:hypothetical protein